MKNNTKIKLLTRLIYFIFFFLFVFLIVSGYFNLQKSSKIHIADAIDMIDQRMYSLFAEINRFPRTASDDVLFLSRLSCLDEVLNPNRVEIELYTFKELVKRNFLEFLKGSSAYYQLRYIDEKGNEVIKAEFDENSYRIVSDDELQNKKDRYYFIETIKLDEGDVYVSQLDLNIEEGVLENRGTEKNSVYVPVMRYATPVFNETGERKGIIISNIYADYFLDDIRKFQRKGDTVFLVNSEGYYMAHPNRRKEFAFILGTDDNLYNDYPEVAEQILLGFNRRKIETEDSIFSFRHISPALGNFEAYQGAKKIMGEYPEENYFWVLISVSEKSSINSTLNNLKNSYLLSLLIVGSVILLGIFLVFIINFDFIKRRIK